MSNEIMVSVEVAYATPAIQKIIALQVMSGCTAYQAVVQSGIAAAFPEINLDQVELGVFGKLEVSPKGRVLIAGDRVEIYRPLQIDPKEARQARAVKIKREKEQSRRDKKRDDKKSKRVRTTDQTSHFNS